MTENCREEETISLVDHDSMNEAEPMEALALKMEKYEYPAGVTPHMVLGVLPKKTATHMQLPKTLPTWNPKSKEDVVEYHKKSVPGLPEKLYDAFGEAYHKLLVHPRPEYLLNPEVPPSVVGKSWVEITTEQLEKGEYQEETEGEQHPNMDTNH